jgi:endonuclease YncB( thermonuclease family)
MAWHYTRYARDQAAAERVAYAAMEREARERRAGLWHETEPVPPWDFRSGGASPRQTSSAGE